MEKLETNAFNYLERRATFPPHRQMACLKTYDLLSYRMRTRLLLRAHALVITCARDRKQYITR